MNKFRLKEVDYSSFEPGDLETGIGIAQSTSDVIGERDNRSAWEGGIPWALPKQR